MNNTQKNKSRIIAALVPAVTNYQPHGKSKTLIHLRNGSEIIVAGTVDEFEDRIEYQIGEKEI